MKKALFVVVLALCIICMVPHNVVYADEASDELYNTVITELDGINFDKLNAIVDELAKEDSFVGSSNFKDRVKSILDGEYFNDYSGLGAAVASLALSQAKSFVPTILIILAVAMLGGIINSFKSSKTDGVGNIAHFACYSLIIMLVAVVFKQVCSITNTTLSSMQNQMTAIFPILLALLTSIGSMASFSVYSPIVAVLTNGVGLIFTKVMYPIFILSFIFVILGHLTDSVKLKNINGFISSSFKWIVGIIFTLFSGLLTIQGITAGRADGVSVKLTKFTVKSYIPIIGSYISEGMDFIVLGSSLIKNAVGLSGLLIVIFSIISPVITIVVLKLALKLCAGIIEPLGNSKVTSFLSDCSNVLIYPIVIILAVAFMYIITLSLIVGTANIM